MGNRSRGIERVIIVRRRAGQLREIVTSGERRFLVLKGPRTDRLLEVGTELCGRDLEELDGPLAHTAGIALAYRLLSVRDRSEWEIRSALSREVRSEVVEEIVQVLKRQGYLDDRRFASGYVRYMMDHRPSGPHLLRRKLRRAGIDGDIVEAEMSSAMPPEHEQEVARELARGKLKGSVDRKRSVRRIHDFLIRRGFSNDTVNDICARILRGEITGEGDE